MKNIFLISVVSVLFFSCVNDPEEVYHSGKKIQYKIVGFYSVEDISVDLNNDGIKNNDIMLETDYYFDNYSGYYPDLEEIRGINTTKKGKVRETGYRNFQFILPKQYFNPHADQPFTELSFERSSYTIHMDMNKNGIYESIYIDDENSVLQFEKTSETQYEAIIEKKYYDFTFASYVKHKYKVVFEKM